MQAELWKSQYHDLGRFSVLTKTFFYHHFHLHFTVIRENMATDWLGSIVSINCGDSLGVYQGRVSAVDQVSQTISLTRPFHNGVKCLVPEVTFRAGDITELKILEIPGSGSNGPCGDFQHTDLGITSMGCPGAASQNGTGKLVKKPSLSSSAPQTIPKRTDVKSQDVTVSPQQHQCSKSYMDRHMETLAQSKGFRRRHNSYSGLVVPSVSYELHKKILSVAEKHGLTLERRLEMTGVCASQMALSLLGGPNRLNPKNIHQRPTVALLCGPHVKGAQGISCGRHLSNHDVQVILFLPNFVKMLESITNEMMLFSKTQGQPVSSIKDLPDTPVDLVINCLDCHENAFLRDQPWHKAAVDWANRNRAPVLSIDPPAHDTEQGIDAKWSLALGLPLPLGERAGRVYLCDIGIPQKVFQEVGINYHSPFGCKFVIPLHST
ncbi:enhancer of mRNA-decapping protein 3 isoform X3 [Varanus komodoensis]|uniref:enhancer of mRNA-decapping protein 3 isoform X3 n=1 Tax=Varanus komodoensis TaxID=61221 RepID=UPI001CF7A732|nr:enhancer of mRNA-decapping protein 3 isoform X3 [Varanus komodoensis]